MKRLFATMLLAAAVFFPARAREVINLNRNWQFSFNNDLRPSSRTSVNIPHTWNYDAVSTRQEYARGIGNYIKEIVVPADWEGRRIYLRFHGVNSEANLFINGRYVGEHQGGYTAFTFEITPFVRLGEVNNIWVRVNNSPQLDYMPINSDFNIYGGIYRDVELIVTRNEHISVTHYSSDGVYLTQKNITDDRAEIDAAVMLSGIKSGNYQLNIRVKDPVGERIVEEKTERVKIDKGEGSATVSLTVESPKLWNGIRDSFQYEFIVRLTDGGEVLDSLTVPLGLRYYDVDATNGFTLNGKKYPVNGVTRYQDRGGTGIAFRNVQHEEDFDLMLEMGATAVRMTNYPSDPYFYSLCDRYGMIVWSEIPFAGPDFVADNAYMNKLRFRENGKEQLLEMIYQNYNHASVLFWGIFSNLTLRGADDPTPYVRELHALARSTDPSRYTICTSNQDGEINFVTDLNGWSQYLGWKEGTVSDVNVWLNQLAKEWGYLRSAIGEYGAGGSILHQEDSLRVTSPRDRRHPERWQTQYHVQFYGILKRHPKIWGSFIHSMFDFGVYNYRGGDAPGVCDYGLVTYDRRWKKDAFYFYKANWNKTEAFVHITEKRWDERPTHLQTVRIFSNQNEVELLLNGESKGVRKGRNGVFTWKDIEFKDGTNTLEAFSGRVSDYAEVYINTVHVIR